MTATETEAAPTPEVIYGIRADNGDFWPDRDGDLDPGPGWPGYLRAPDIDDPKRLRQRLRDMGHPGVVIVKTSTVSVYLPPLPSEAGAIIRATTAGIRGDVRTLFALTEPVDSTDADVWCAVNGNAGTELNRWHSAARLRDVEVLFDPAALAAELTAAAS